MRNCFPFFFLLCLYWIYCNIASVLCFEVFGHEACGILVPWLGIEPTPLALGGEVLTSGLSGKSSFFFPGPGILARGAKWWPRKRVLGCTQSPIQELNSINRFTQTEIKISVPCYRYFILLVEPRNKGCVCVQVCVCACTHMCIWGWSSIQTN